MAIVVKYPWLTEANPPVGRPYRTYIVVGGFLQHVVSEDHQNVLKVLGQLEPKNGPRQVGLAALKAFPLLPGTPAPDAN